MTDDKCKKHGPLTQDNLIKKGKNKSGSQAYRCKFCMRDLHKKYYIKNKEKIDEKNRLYRKKNKEQMREMRREHYHATKKLNSSNKRKLDKKVNKKQVENLSDRYVKHLLSKNKKLKYGEVTQQLIEEKRKVLINMRESKNKEYQNE
jgi:hypothetical protein